MIYADLLGQAPSSTIAVPGANLNRALIGVGTEIMTVNDFKLMLEYLNTFSTTSSSNVSTIRFSVAKTF